MNIDVGKYKIEGLSKIYQLLETVDVKTRGGLLRSAYRRGAALIKRNLVADTPSSSKLTKKMAKRQGIFVAKKMLTRSKLRDQIRVQNDPESYDGILIGFSKKGYYARYLERGTIMRKNKKRKNANRGKITGSNFVERSYERSLPGLMKFYNDELTYVMSKIIERKARAIGLKVKKLGL